MFNVYLRTSNVENNLLRQFSFSQIYSTTWARRTFNKTMFWNPIYFMNIKTYNSYLCNAVFIRIFLKFYAVRGFNKVMTCSMHNSEIKKKVVNLLLYE